MLTLRDEFYPHGQMLLHILDNCTDMAMRAISSKDVHIQGYQHPFSIYTKSLEMQAQTSKYYVGHPITGTLYLLIIPRHHDTGILIPAQQRVLAVLRLAILHICPIAHEVLV